MEEWGKPPPPPPPPPRPTGAGGDQDWQPPAQRVGFKKSFDNLVERKLRELRGAKWADTESKGGQRARAAEAKRRAAAEMARRIERQTGRRPKESTIRRAAAADRTPRGADQTKIDRQAQIDAAGGTKPFADKAGVSRSSVSRWARDPNKSLRGAITVVAVVDGQLVSRGGSYPKENVYAEGNMGPPASDDLLAAVAMGNTAVIKEILGPFVAHNADWQGEAERSFTVQRITELIIDGITVTGLG
jgi:hypothetical protein